MRPVSVSEKWVEGAKELARAAGEAIMAIYHESAQDALVATKQDNSPLTRADLAAHQVIVAGLSRLTPDIPVVSEEGSQIDRSHLADARFWLVDPLDGTKEFLARNGEFTVNIALVEQGRPVFGVVNAPAIGVTYWGGDGLGAWRETARKREPIRVAEWPVAGEPVRVVASKSHLNGETEAYIAGLGAHELVQAGSSLKFCRIAEGSADVYPRLAPTCEWDTAAAQAVVEAAGGVVMQPDGSSLVYGKPDVLNPWFIAGSCKLVI